MPTKLALFTLALSVVAYIQQVLFFSKTQNRLKGKTYKYFNEVFEF